MLNPFKVIKDFFENRKLNKEVLSLKQKRLDLNRERILADSYGYSYGGLRKSFVKDLPNLTWKQSQKRVSEMYRTVPYNKEIYDPTIDGIIAERFKDDPDYIEYEKKWNF